MLDLIILAAVFRIVYLLPHKQNSIAYSRKYQIQFSEIKISQHRQFNTADEIV